MQDAVDPSEVHGRRLALVLFEDDAGDDDEGLVIHGRGRWDGSHLRFEGKGPEGPVFNVPEEALLELHLVRDDVRDMLGDAEYWTMLPASSLPEGVDPGTFGTRET